MESLKDNTKVKELKKELLKDYQNNLKDRDFQALINKLNIKEELGYLYNSSLEDCTKEMKNCQNCNGLYECKNKVLGHYLYPEVMGKAIDFIYIPCKFKKEQERLLKLKNTASKELLNARFNKIDVKDKNRVAVIKWIKKFYDEFDIYKDMKGLYLHGSFGSGKSFLLYALLNELNINKKVDFIALYFPDVLKDLKEDWDTYNSKMERYSTVPILLLDDIGAEQVSEWGRDEVLGTILQNRMNNHLTTFFTSNLTIEELEYHLSLSKSSLDKVKARRIIERIKQLSEDIELITDNKRN
mgnify:FL=1